jgi:hypothetical protein
MSSFPRPLPYLMAVFGLVSGACVPSAAEPTATAGAAAIASPTIGGAAAIAADTVIADASRVLGAPDRTASLRLNDFGVLKKLAVEAFGDSGWSSRSFSNETLWRDVGSCNTRTLKLKDVRLAIPLATGDLDVDVVSASSDRLRVAADVGSAYVTATLEYKRTRTNSGCFWWSSSKTATAEGTARGFEFGVDASVRLSGHTIQLGTVYDIDAAFGSIEVDLDSTNVIEDWILEGIEDLIGRGDWADVVSYYVEEAANETTVRNTLKDAVNAALATALEVEDTARLNGSRVTASASVDTVDVISAPAIVAELGYDLDATSPASCASGVTFRAESITGSAVVSAYDLDLRVPRHALAEAVYVYARTGALCETISVSGSSLELRPSGTITSRVGSTVGGQTGVIVAVPMAVHQGGSAVGTLSLELELFVQLDASGDLVVTNLASPQLVGTTGSIGYYGVSVPLSSLTATIQSRLDTTWPAGALAYRFLPAVLPLTGTGYALTLRDVEHTGGGWVTIALDLGTAGTGGTSPGGGIDGPGGTWTPGGPIDLPEIIIVGPEDRDDDGDEGSISVGDIGAATVASPGF